METEDPDFTLGNPFDITGLTLDTPRIPENDYSLLELSNFLIENTVKISAVRDDLIMPESKIYSLDISSTRLIDTRKNNDISENNIYKALDEQNKIYDVDRIQNTLLNKNISLSRNSLRKSYLDEALPESNNNTERDYARIGASILKAFDSRIFDLEPSVASNPGFSMLRLNGLINETTDAIAKRERSAHKFRSGRMRIGKLRDITRRLQDATMLKTKAGVSRIIGKSDVLLDGTYEEDEMHRMYAPLITALYSDSETRQLLMGGIDENIKAESDALKAESLKQDGKMTIDWLVVGSGVHGSIASSELRGLLPDARIVMVDKSAKLGGQFGSYGERAVFYGNSRANRRQESGTTELPGKDGNINSFGPHAPVQLPDLTASTYWTNVEMGDAVKLNGYLSAEAMQSTDVSKVQYVNTDDGGYYEVEMKDLDTGDTMSIRVKNLVVTAGLGERIALGSQGEQTKGYYSVEDLLSKFADAENVFPMEEFVDKSVAMIGAGDSARIALELFARLAPDEAYGKSKVQLGSGPESIDWFGVDFSDREGFVGSTRPRYSQLASFIDRESSKDNLIHPIQDTKVTRVEPTDDGRVTVYYRGADGNEVSSVYDYVIDATTLVSKVNDPFDSITGLPVAVPGESESYEGSMRLSRRIGQQLRGHRIVFAGPAAKNELTIKEKATFAMGIRENTAAIWANSPRTVELMQVMAENVTGVKVRSTKSADVKEVAKIG